MDPFIEGKDELSRSIQYKSAELFSRLSALKDKDLDIPFYCLAYFRKSHLNRIFFSIQTSAQLLYKAIVIKNKPVTEITLLDYGAGIGTLFLLAKMVGCRYVIYNDHMHDWKNSAETISRAINIEIDDYIVGDIKQTLASLQDKNIKCDIILSRNVVEHIYDLHDFFSATHMHQPGALHYHSTTANIYNPAAHLKHIVWHKKWENTYRAKRREWIEKQITSPHEADLLAKKTRGLAGQDLKNAIDVFKSTGLYPDPAIHYSNTCDPETGVWAEHLLSFKQYRKLVNTKIYTLEFAPGFWDTHYKNTVVNLLTRLFNMFIRGMGKAGIFISPFIYIIAEPRQPK